MNKILNILKYILFIFILLFAIYYVQKVFEDKRSVFEYHDFFESDTNYDVMFFGSSRIQMAFSPMYLWDKYGVTSYNFGNPTERYVQSYWVMKNVFEYKKPKVAVFDVSMFYANTRYDAERPELLHRAWDAFPLTKLKYEAIKDIYKDDSKLQSEFLFNIIKYHTRWNDLSKNDFFPTYSYEKGSNSYNELKLTKSIPQSEIVYDDYKDPYYESDLNTEYLKKIIELCQDNNVELLLVTIPYPAANFFQRATNYVDDIVKDYDVKYINYVKDPSYIDVNVDFYDEEHLNPSGAQKNTDYIGNYLVETYNLKNKKDDKKYEKWNMDYEGYLDTKINMLNKVTNPLDTFMLLHDRDYSTIVYLKKNSDYYENENAIKLIQNIKREHKIDNNEIDYSPLKLLEKTTSNKDNYVLITSKNNVYESNQRDNVIQTSFGEVKYKITDDIITLRINNIIVVNESLSGINGTILVINNKDKKLIMKRCI